MKKLETICRTWGTIINDSKHQCGSLPEGRKKRLRVELKTKSKHERLLSITRNSLEQNQVLKTSFTFFPQIEGNYQKKHGILYRTWDINIDDSKHQYHSFPEVRKKRLKLSCGRNSKKKDDHQLLKRPRSMVSRKAEK